MDFLKKYGINIKNTDLLLTALTHSSYSNEHDCDNYERLEFLGDAVLEIIVSEYLYSNGEEPEGTMSKIRAAYVSENACNLYAETMGFIPYIRTGRGVKRCNRAIIADVFESILGVVYLEYGLKEVKKITDEVIIPVILSKIYHMVDYKTQLQELVQTNKNSLEYRLISESGPAHNKTYEMAAVIDNIIYGKGIGKTKKEAEQHAAEDAIKKQAK